MTRTRSSANQAGTKAESDVARHLARELNDDRIERRAKSGAKDRGDVGGVRLPGGGRVVIEVKDCARIDLAGWVAEAEIERGNDDAEVGVVWHKRRGKSNPADWYVTMTGHTFMRLLGATTTEET